MKIKLCTQLEAIENTRLFYDFGEQTTLTYNYKTDIFDFSILKNGDKAEEIETELDINPIINAFRDNNGVLHLEVLHQFGIHSPECERMAEELGYITIKEYQQKLIDWQQLEQAEIERIEEENRRDQEEMEAESDGENNEN